MEKHDAIFSPLYISMVRVGETGGILQQTVSQLAKLLDRDEKVKSSMKTAAAYPLFVLILGVVSAFVVIRFILPKMLESITGGVSILPWPTKLLMGVSEFFASYGWLVFLTVIFIAAGFVKWKKTPAGRMDWDGFKLKVPVLGSVIKSIAVGRFTRTLGALTKSGITILEALKVVRDTLGNEVLAKEIDKVSERVCAGDSLAEPLGQSGMFPPLLVQIVSIGEHTGKLDELLLNAADTFDAQADAAINRFMAVLPAVLILLLGLVIAFIIAGALLPIIAMDMGGITV
jgi:type II secretory pathway component PulF